MFPARQLAFAPKDASAMKKRELAGSYEDFAGTGVVGGGRGAASEVLRKYF